MLRDGHFRTDERAIEGLPIRLVIALVVGVTSLSVMMNMLSGISGLAMSELDVHPEPEVVTTGEQAIETTVIDSDGESVADATVIVKSGTAEIEGVQTATTDEQGRATVEIDPRLRANQEDGTLEFDVKPPAGTEYVDKQQNTRILVVAD